MKKQITDVKRWREIPNLVTGNSIISELGYRTFQDLLANGRIEKTANINDGSSVYKINQ